MILKKAALFFGVLVSMVFPQNLSFSSEQSSMSLHPDYDCEFCGKDRCENFNRKIFAFNTKLNKYAIHPVTVLWASIIPKYGMERIQGIYNNVVYPKRLVSCFIQRDFKAAGTETVRFLTNSTIGLGGMFDPAKSKFKIKPCNEDMAQALAKCKVKEGPFIAVPVIPPDNLRNLCGKALDYAFEVPTYILGPIAVMAKAAMTVNRTTCLQPLAASIDWTYADPYSITKKLVGIDNYIKNNNLDRDEVLARQQPPQKDNVIPVNRALVSDDHLKPDVYLEGYNPQTPLVDGMRTALFDDKSIDKSVWSEFSLWNRSFVNRIKTSYIQVSPDCTKYKFRYILQKDKNSPLAILYPSIGESVMGHHPMVWAKLFYDKGYSVIIQGSVFNWEFVKSMPESYRPGLPAKDAEQLRITTKKIIDKLEGEKGRKFCDKVVLGTSFGALTSLFVAAQEEKDNTLGISKYIALCPPIELIYALNEADKNSLNWHNNPSDVKHRTAVTAQKVIKATEEMSYSKDAEEKIELPFDDDEAKLISSFLLNQKLADLIFTIEKTSSCRKTDLYERVKNMGYADYAKQYLLNGKSLEDIDFETSLYSVADFLKNSHNYKIYHSVNDYFVSPKQLAWLKKQTGCKCVLLDNGSHLGFTYRKEFQSAFLKDIDRSKGTELTLDLPSGKKL